ncbi:MAG: restriction endonuclease subunit S [Nitrosospira sp.]|nr:restriction endonuclease subunit S [Nitrosospira sp.]
MSEWLAQPLGSLATFQKGRKVETSEHPREGFVPYLGASAISGIVEEYGDTRIGVMSAPGDVLMLWDGERSGLVGKAQIGIISSTVARLSPKMDVEGDYLYYALDSKFEWIQGHRTGTGVPHVPKDLSRILSISYPKNKNEQRRIAEILSTMDKAIKKTKALIAKYQQIRVGLMHDLFTRGVTADGKLRPSREKAPELYKETPIGWIPKEWELEHCSNLCTRICVGIVIQPTQYYVTDGVPAFRSANIREDGIDPSNIVYISPLSNTLLAKSQVRAGDILSVRTGYPGTSAVVPREFHGVNCIDILISSPSARIDAGFLCNWINSSFGKEQVLRQQGGMAQQHFNVGEMRELLVALPIREEQLRIRCRASSVEKKLQAEKKLQEKLHCQKLGLMSDLLTGKVRITN